MLEMSAIILSESPGYNPEQILDEGVLLELGNPHHQRQVVGTRICLSMVMKNQTD
jgi:hypothetical protein